MLALAAASLAAAGEEFDWTDPQVEPREIESGGPGKDGIPAILRPRFDSAADTPLRPRDLVVGISRAGDHRAYPLRILNWHEVVNDVVGGTPVVVTWCPLTGSAIVFDRRVAGRTLSFGVSGRLYQSNVLLYDHQTATPIGTESRSLRGLRGVAGAGRARATGRRLVRGRDSPAVPRSRARRIPW